MELVRLLKAKAADNKAAGGVTLAFLGDSVTQGCFALYRSPDGTLGTFFDQMHVYHQYLKQILSILYPSVPINIINAGISSNTAQDGLQRLERDVICHRPDLAVVCFGLNDANNSPEGISAYETALRAIFRSLHQAGIETVFMTPNMTAHLTAIWMPPKPSARKSLYRCAMCIGNGSSSRAAASIQQSCCPIRSTIPFPPCTGCSPQASQRRSCKFHKPYGNHENSRATILQQNSFFLRLNTPLNCDKGSVFIRRITIAGHRLRF